MRKLLSSKKAFSGIGVFMLSIFIPRILDSWQVINPSFAWGLNGLGIGIGLMLVLWGLIEPEKTRELLGYNPQPKKRLNLLEELALNESDGQMKLVHGHSDLIGLKVELLNGVLLNDAMPHNCARCGKPRNQKGSKIYGYE